MGQCPGASRAPVRDVAAVNDLFDKAEGDTLTGNRSGLLRGQHAANVLGDPTGRDGFPGGDSVGELLRKPRIFELCLGGRETLARLGERIAQLGEDLRSFGGIRQTLDGEVEGGNTGDGGLGHGTPTFCLERVSAPCALSYPLLTFIIIGTCAGNGFNFQSFFKIFLLNFLLNF